MKKLVLIAVLIVLTSGLIYALSFYRQNLSGAWPTINPTPLTSSSSKPITTTKELSGNQTELPLVLPPRLSLSYFAKDTGGARDLVLDPQETLLVSLSGQGKVVAIPEANKTVTILTNLNRPHGLAFFGNTLFVAESDGVSTYDYNPQDFTAKNRKKIIDLPEGGNHWSRSLLVKDNSLYISVGSTCNVCNESDWRRTKILVSNLDGSDLKVFASGLRNSVFLTLHPKTGDIWATEMGRDLLGEDIPPDEINILKEGGNYGWPICYGQNVHDTNFDKNTYIRNPCEAPYETPSFIDLPAHSAPLGIAFIPESWPKEYRGKLLVSFHGSWNRTVPTGYKIAMIDPESKKTSDFISGWLKLPKDSYGRPVDLLFDSQGNLYVSDDKAGVIYKVTP